MALSANLLQSLESECTDLKLATYIKVAVIHCIYNVGVFSDGQVFLFFIH